MIGRDKTLDILKGIAILLVLYGHVIEHSMAPWKQDFFANPVFKFIYTFHMPLFFFISGYLTADSLKKHDLKDVLQSRCRSLLVPFVTLTVLGAFVTYVLDHSWTQAIRLDDLMVWFLFTLFAVSLLLLLSVVLEARLGIISFALVYGLLMAMPHNDIFALYYIKWFYVFYLAGYFIRRYEWRIPGPIPEAAVMATAAIAFIVLFRYWQSDDYIYIDKMHDLSTLPYRYLMGFLGIGLAFYAGRFLAASKAEPFLGLVGRYSLDIYIIQMFILEGLYPRLIARARVHLDLSDPAVLYGIAPCMALGFAGICLLVSKTLIRKNALLDRLLLGGRR